MKRKEFEISINATPKKIWDTLLDDATYRLWTAPFTAGSHAVSNWEEGSRVLFLNSDNEGMISIIEKKTEPYFISFTHIGMIDRNGNEDFDSELVKKWAGAKENYTLKSDGSTTKVFIETDVDEDHIEMFTEVWPKALQILKTLAESN